MVTGGGCTGAVGTGVAGTGVGVAGVVGTVGVCGCARIGHWMRVCWRLLDGAIHGVYDKDCGACVAAGLIVFKYH